jgi:hypothetical protein
VGTSRRVGYRYADQFDEVMQVAAPPDDPSARIDPTLMQTHVRQQHLPAWDRERLANNRQEMLRYYHEHRAGRVLAVGPVVSRLIASTENR